MATPETSTVYELSKGTIIHFHGFPFELEEDALIIGTSENFNLAMRENMENEKSQSD